MEWISTEKQKPKENQVVWGLLKDEHGPCMFMYEFISDGGYWAFTRIYDVPFLAGDKWYAESFHDEQYNVTHWQPLPNPTLI
jgi:hypothetical protein